MLTRLLRARPLLLAAVLFLIGCVAQYAMRFPSAALWAALGTCLLAAVCLRGKRTLAAAMLVLTLIPAGALRFDVAWNYVSPMPAQTSVQLSGRISEEPAFNAETQRTICVLDDLIIDGDAQHGKLRLYLRGDEALLRDVRLGQRIDVVARLWRTNEATNPGQFDSSDYCRSLGLRNYATAEIESAAFADTARRLSDLPGRMRTTIGTRIDRLFPGNVDIARALILGDRSELSSEARSNYARAGAAHLLAISGMHIGILAGAVALLFGRVMKRSAAFGLTLFLLAAYGVLIGFTPSVTRAILMYAFLGMAPLLGRHSDGLTRLGASMLIYLLIRPLAVMDAGFVLSYGATAGIFLLEPALCGLPLLQRFTKTNSDFGRLSRRIPRWIAKAVAMTLAAQLAILPAVIHFYGAQPVWSLFTNLLAAPITMVGYILALTATVINCPLLATAADFSFGLLTRLVAGIASLPLAELRVARFPLWLTLISILLCLAASELSRLPRVLRRFLPLALLLAIPIANLCAWITTLGVSVVFLDVGQADCAVIRSEGHVYLVDAGDDYSPAADYLSAMNYAPDAVFLTHPHADHAGGLADILELCTPGRIYISPNWDGFDVDPILTETLDMARREGAEIVTVAAGDTIALSEHVALRVLSPKAGISTNSANDDSLILRLEYGSARALFPADASGEAVEGISGDVDLLKVAHHGARNGTTAALLAETTPSAAVISVGRDNSYGHPAEQTLKLLEASGAQIYRTDLSGAITCKLYEDGTLKLRCTKTSEGGYGLE